jgi:ornithine carbamoyltransferase
MTATLPGRIPKAAAPDFTRDLDLTADEARGLLDLAGAVKRDAQRYAHALDGRSIALLFEKPSLRTRLTFELAIRQLGGFSVGTEGRIDAREPLRDVARNLDRWVNAIVVRTFAQSVIEELALWSSIPVINALSDSFHPCQALADMLTLEEKLGGLRGATLAFAGDGNNVAHSLMLCSARFGVHFAIAAPEGFGPDAAIAAEAARLASASGARLTITTNLEEALAGADAVYTDVWASMGQEAEAAARRRTFAPYQIDERAFSAAKPGALFMHCLPAKRGLEVTDAVMESPRSVVFDQAENRLHAQKALLLMLL